MTENGLKTFKTGRCTFTLSLHLLITISILKRRVGKITIAARFCVTFHLRSFCFYLKGERLVVTNYNKNNDYKYFNLY